MSGQADRAAGPADPSVEQVQTSHDPAATPEDPAAAPLEPAATPARATGMRALTGEDFSFAEAIGGVRGLVESVLPGLVFVVVYLATGGSVTQRLTFALVASAGCALGAVVLRLVQRTPLTQALSGVVGVAIGVVWAWRSGEAENYFALGLWTNAAYGLAALVSVLVRWPLVGLVVGLLKSEGTAWRRDPARDAERTRYTWATWLWVAMFGARLAVQLPAYLTGDVAVLGAARLAMGVPLWALTLWLTWLLVRRAGPAAPQDPPRSP